MITRPGHHRNLFLILVIIIGIVGVLYSARQKQQEPVFQEVPQEKNEQIIESDVLSFVVPSVLEEPSFQLDINVLQPVQSLEVVWQHPANVQEESYILEQFKAGDTKALYNINAVFGNLLPGENHYFVKALPIGSEESDKDVVEFTLQFPVQHWSEVFPDGVELKDLPEQTDAEEVEINGLISVGEAVPFAVRVYSYHPKSGKSSYVQLSQFESGDTTFSYNGSAELGNVFYGENLYVVEVLDDQGGVISRKKFSFDSTYETVYEQVESMFGAFKKVPGGWYVSTRLPWFSLRPVYETVYFQSDERSVVMPRPTLTYTAQADKSTPLCDYLANIDYEQENYVYRGYSYETCQKYRQGVAVYDRFLSLLTYSPVEVVERVKFADIKDSASSALVLIETGGMPETRPHTLSFEGLDQSFDQESVENIQKDDSADDDREWFYVYQLLITEDVPYVEGKIGDISAEGAEQRLQDIEKIRALLNQHSGQELFSEMLFTGADAIDPVVKHSEE